MVCLPAVATGSGSVHPGCAPRKNHRGLLMLAVFNSLIGTLFLPSDAAAATAAMSETEMQTAQGQFEVCRQGLSELARENGLADQEQLDALKTVQFRPEVIELDRRQPEFTTPFSDYYGKRVTPFRIDRGQELFASHRRLLEQLQQRSGVPPAILLSFWGLETNYGGYRGDTPTLDALATLACDTRRSQFFRTELFNALRVAPLAGVEASAMTGSWAGALGHVQFMPSAYLAVAVDGDQDGKIDLWNSIPDALASAANYLQDAGWRRGERWGREVLLPTRFDYGLLTRTGSRPVREWSAAGVTDAFGKPLPDSEMPATLLLPSGHTGPAFLAYPNFNVIMRWNRSTYYALAVGRLAERIAGSGPLQTPLPEETVRLNRALVLRLQQRLIDEGYLEGGADGILGPASRAALARWQAAAGQIPDGYPDQRSLQALGAL